MAAVFLFGTVDDSPSTGMIHDSRMSVASLNSITACEACKLNRANTLSCYLQAACGIELSGLEEALLPSGHSKGHAQNDERQPATHARTPGWVFAACFKHCSLTRFKASGAVWGAELLPQSPSDAFTLR